MHAPASANVTTNPRNPGPPLSSIPPIATSEDYEAKATNDVFLYSDSDALCHVRALNARFAEVGVATQTVARGAGGQQRITTAIITTEFAVTAVVDYCEPA